MPLITTPRLWLAEAGIKDVPFFRELMNSPTWLAHIGDRGIHSDADALKYIQYSLIKSYRENGYGLWKMVRKVDQKPVGICGLVRRASLPGPDLGFAILPAYERLGYTSEAAQATLEYARDALDITEILAITSPANIGSQALLRKVGLSHVDTRVLDGESKPVLVFST